MRGGLPGEQVQVRGFVAERIVVSTLVDPYLSLRALADYAGLSVKTLRKHIDADPDNALPCYRVGGGKILVRRSEYDLWIAAKRCVGRPSLAKAVREIGLG
jgi:hypothetical protein